jgi:hypothetical protein
MLTQALTRRLASAREPSDFRFPANCGSSDVLEDTIAAAPSELRSELVRITASR